MSKISTVIDTLRTIILTIAGFSAKTEIPIAESPRDNPSAYLKDAWGIKILDSSPGVIGTFKDTSEIRNFGIILTNEVLLISNKTTEMFTIKKALLEDAVELRKKLVDYDQWGIQSSIQKVEYVGDSGLSTVRSNKANFYLLEVMFSVEITEDL